MSALPALALGTVAGAWGAGLLGLGATVSTLLALATLGAAAILSAWAASQGRPGLAPAQRHGWHAIVVTEIVPGKTRTLTDAETEIRERISQQRRLGAIVAIVHGLETEGLVQYDETGVQRLLSMPGLPRRAE